jgi:hypothetical protein
MAFAMNFGRESLSGKPPVPAGRYRLRLNGFKQELSKGKDSINLNPQFEVIDNPEHNGRKIFESLNTKGAWVIQDMVHATGNQMVEVQDGNQGTEAANFTPPGIWLHSDENPDDPTKWEYAGPLMNATLEVEVYESEYNGRKSNKIRQYFCTIPGCVEKHSTNLG